MNARSLRILEYDKIINKLTEHAGSEPGKKLCRELKPISDFEKILRLQMETSHALSRIYAKGSTSFSGLKDVSGSLLRLNVGASLNAAELLNVASSLETALKIKNYGKGEESEETQDSLTAMFNEIEPLLHLCKEIRRCIISEDEIADDASAGLKSVRRSIQLTNDRIKQQLNTMVNSQTMGQKLQDNIVTMRNGRYCLPVKAEYRSQVNGMIHDQSATGSTLFIEPAAVVNMNNELSQLFVKEKEEIEKVLASLSNSCADSKEAIKHNQEILIALDFIFARAAFAKSYKGTEPRFNENGYINLKKARHPLIDQKKVVPIDVVIGNDYSMLVVTGPNTGGKTVSLKTTGLLCLMGQSGLHIPAFDESELSVFDDVYADIGDEQSIEQNLSTFSAHMTNIVSILRKSTYKSLVLFDELCSGTDPTEGAALAISILKNCLLRKVTTMATTHYSELKVFALTTKGVLNACCEFNVETLSPTYRLLIGVPGKSNAFAISQKIGLPGFIIDDAKKHMDAADKNFEDLLAELEDSRVQLELEKEEVDKTKAEAERLKKEYETKSKNLDLRKESIIDKANEKAASILQDAKDFADETIRDINKLGISGNTKELEKRRSGLRDKLGKVSKQKQVQVKKPSKILTEKELKPGTAVRVVSMNINGYVTSAPNNKGEVKVQMGILSSFIKITDLELRDEEEIKSPMLTRSGAGKIKMSKSSEVSTSINVIGLTVDEAMSKVDKYLDDAYLAHLSTVNIIHGRGTGALRNAVASLLKRSSFVKDFYHAKAGEGDTGITIVEFK